MRKVEHTPRCSPRGRRERLGPLTLAVFLGLLVLFAVPLGPAAAQESDAEVVTFDDYPANISGAPSTEPITNEFVDQGVIFPFGVTALVYNDSSFPPRPDLPRSGDTVISTCYSAEFCSSSITMAFRPALARLTLYAGYSRSLDEPADVVLEGYNQNGDVITRDVVTIPASDQATATDIAITIEDSAGEMVRAQARFVEEGRFLSGLIVDDLTLTPFVAFARLDPEPSAVRLTVESDPVQQTVELTNTGNTALPAGSVAFDGFEELSEQTDVDLSVAASNDCLARVEPRETCQLTILATPNADNQVSLRTEGVLRVTSQILESALEIPMSVVVAPAIQLPPETTSSTSTPATTGTTPSTEQTIPDTIPPGPVEEPDPPDEWWFPVVIVAGIVALGAIVRRSIRKRRTKPPPKPPESPSQNEKPNRSTPRPQLTAKYDDGTQRVESPPGAKPSLVVALNEQPGATILIDHHEGTAQ